MKYTRLFLIIIVILGMVLVACESDSSSDDADDSVAETEVNDTEATTEEPIEPTPTQEAEEEPDDTIETDAQTVDSDAFTVTVTGAYETTLPFVTYQYNDGTLGRYDLRFRPNEDEGVLAGDLVIVLPATLEAGTYAISGDGGVVPQASIGDFEQVEATIYVNLLPPDSFPLAMNNPIEGELVITDNSDGVLTGTFTLVAGSEEEQITVTGVLNGLNGSLEP